MRIIIIFCVLLNLSFTSSHQHPHGHPISIQFINNSNEDDSRNFNYEGLKEILMHPEVENRKVVVISMIGNFREGKSFFLDYCLRFLYANYPSINTNLNTTFLKNEKWWGEPNEPLSGFSWKHGIDADTKGILIWSDVFLHEENGQKFAIILIDTQGLSEPHRSAGVDAKVFAITSLISSVQIFNHKGLIKERDLEYLKIVTDFTKKAIERKQEKSVSRIFKAFQNFLFLLRDWDDEDIGFGYNGGILYLNKILSGNGDENSPAQIVRDNIRKSYEKIVAFLLPNPGTIVEKKSYDGRWSGLEEDFKELLKVVIESLLSPRNLVKKKIFGEDLTAKDLMNYASNLFITFESLEFPDMDFIFNIAVENELKKISDELSDEYMNNMNKRIDFNRQNFISALFDDHVLVQTAIIMKFKEMQKMGDDEMEAEYEKVILNRTTARFLEWKDSIIKTYQEYLDGKMKEEEARKKAHDELLRQLEEEKRESERLKQEAINNMRRHPNHRAGFWLCKIFTFGIHKCK